MEEKIQCPKCKGTNITAFQKGYSLGKGMVGGFLFGRWGLLAGLHGKDKIELHCLNCGNVFPPKPITPQFGHNPPVVTASTVPASKGPDPIVVPKNRDPDVPEYIVPYRHTLEEFAGVFVLFSPILTLLIWIIFDLRFLLSFYIASGIVIVILIIIAVVNRVDYNKKSKEYEKNLEEYANNYYNKRVRRNSP
ncbi:MAG: hypothetical protein LBJ61_06185 [Deltaproteobacteria bacterium]|jgi:hypothetical protein|nr:hypothetical protein [Deltaproteobacteria bacterium]